jgi:ribonuclease H2 subunit C
MLAINSHASSHKTVPNLVPCSIKHSGPIGVEQRHWQPQKSHKPVGSENEKASNVMADAPDTQVAYLRGRKLCGKAIPLPAGYKGYVLEKSTEMMQPESQRTEQIPDAQYEREEEQELPGEIKMMGVKAKFDEIMVWAHEAVPNDDDPYVRGIHDWIGLAETVSNAL